MTPTELMDRSNDVLNRDGGRFDLRITYLLAGEDWFRFYRKLVSEERWRCLIDSEVRATHDLEVLVKAPRQVVGVRLSSWVWVQFAERGLSCMVVTVEKGTMLYVEKMDRP